MDPVYKPTNQDELELFVEMQKFMYDVFIGTIKTSMGQHFVHAHEATGIPRLFGGTILLI